MSFLIQSLYLLIAQFPGLAAQMHRPCGRMGRQLQAVMGFLGIASMACGTLAGLGVRGLIDGAFGYFPAILLGLVVAFLLVGGAAALARAIRNPAPATAGNVIPFRRPVEAARQVHGPGVGPTGIPASHSRSLEPFSSQTEDFHAAGSHRHPGLHRPRRFED